MRQPGKVGSGNRATMWSKRVADERRQGIQRRDGACPDGNQTSTPVRRAGLWTRGSNMCVAEAEAAGPV